MKVTLREKKLKNRYSLYLDIYLNGKREYDVLKLYPSFSRSPQKNERITPRLEERLKLYELKGRWN